MSHTSCTEHELCRMVSAINTQYFFGILPILPRYYAVMIYCLKLKCKKARRSIQIKSLNSFDVLKNPCFRNLHTMVSSDFKGKSTGWVEILRHCVKYGNVKEIIKKYKYNA